ncbi:MAG: terminase TerL endonuclease subunit [Pseudomonadota bacterium]
MARPRLSAEEKAKRGTLRHHREREYFGLAAVGELATVPPVPKALVKARDYVGIARAYARDVAEGRIVACKWVKLAVTRQLRDWGRPEGWAYAWDDDEAVAACHFVESCPHVEGRWSSPLIVLEPCQVFLVAALFGWRHRADRTRRRFTTFYFEVARKAAKSTLCAALALYHLLRENEPGASVVCGATTGSQARVVFGIMQKMIRRSSWLKSQGLEAYSNAIVAPDGTAKPVNSKASTLDGLNPSCIVLDEAHAQDFELHDVLKSAQGSRPNPLLLCPTTAGYDLLSVGYALRGQLVKVLEGIFEADHLLGAIYTLDEGDDWRDPRVWIKANPMLGVSPRLDGVRQYCADAQQAPGLEGEFKVKVCCLWAQAASAWLSITAWDRCADAALRIEDFEGKPCWIGADLASIDDLAALVYLFDLPGDLLAAFLRCYLPEGVIDERARAVPAYRQWMEAEPPLLIPTEGSMIDYDRIEADLRADCKRFAVKRIVFDQFGSTQIAGSLSNDGLPAIVEWKSTRTFTPPARELEGRVKHARMRHDGNTLFRWAASNVVVQRRVDGTILPKKESAESPNKIDPIDALLQAMIGRGIGTPKPKEYTMRILGGAKAAEAAK